MLGFTHGVSASTNRSFQRTSTTKRLGIYRFRGLARSADRGRYRYLIRPVITTNRPYEKISL